MTDEPLIPGARPAEQRMRVFISFAEGEEEFADYLGYVLALRGFEPSSSPAPRFRRRVIAKTEASIVVLTAAAAASKRVLGELGETIQQSKPALVLIPGALGDIIAIPEAFSAHPQIHSWRNPDIAGSSLVNGLLALENALDGIRLTRRAMPAAEIPEHVASKASPPAVTSEPAAEPELAAHEAEPAGQAPAAEHFTIEALTSAFAASVPDPFVIPEQAAEPIEPAITPETIAAELIAEPQAEFIFETAGPQLDENPALDPVFTICLDPAYDVLDLTIPAEETPLLRHSPAARLLPPLTFPRLVSSQPAPRVQAPCTPPGQVQSKPPALSARGNARRRSVAHLAIVTASLMCAAANAPWLISFISTARAAAAEEKHRNPAPSLRPAVTVRNSEPEAPAAAIAPAPIPAEPIESEAAEPESAGPALPVIALQAEPTPVPAEEAAAALVLTDAELAQQRDHDDWLAARKVGNLAAYRGYIEKHADGVHYAEAMDRARRRIAELSTQPSSTLVYLTGPAAFRGLPTRDLDGLHAGAAGQDVYIIDRITTRREGEWLVFERGGPWPFLFVNTDEVEKAAKELPVKEAAKAE